jgi:DICT domain-containing protein/signal transduction histidine kinase
MTVSARQDPTSLLSDVLAAVPHLHTQVYFKSSLVALSHAIEDQVLSGTEHPIVFANFQKERYYRQEARRYQKISAVARQVFVLAAPETDFFQGSSPLHLVGLDPEDPLTQEWHLVVIGDSYTACLICRERIQRQGSPEDMMVRDADAGRQFEGIWSFEPTIGLAAATGLLQRVRRYRPDLAKTVTQVKRHIDQIRQQDPQGIQINPAPFAERLVTYLQAGQYKLRRTYQAIQLQERKERLVNRISNAIRRSLDPEGVLETAAQELGKATSACRCLIYRCERQQPYVVIAQEYHALAAPSLRGRRWLVADNPLLDQAMATAEVVVCEDTAQHPTLAQDPRFGIDPPIRAWLVVPIFYQGRLLGLLELHHQDPQLWPEPVVELAEAIGLQVGVALIQAEAFQHMDELNHQLEALDKAKSDLIAVTGHELRTPLSTIQVCLESLSTDPDMPLELRQEMIDTALQDAGRLRQLVQDFLTLSKLESGRIQWHMEPISAVECVELSVSSINARRRRETLPTIEITYAEDLPLIEADGEWLVEVLRKLLDNACKFSDPDGHIDIQIGLDSRPVPLLQPQTNGYAEPSSPHIKITVADDGRGIEPDRVQAIFERFYQAEGSLRRSVGGTGLGLAISRLIVKGMKGQIWAESEGLGQGSQFYITLPILPK